MTLIQNAHIVLPNSIRQADLRINDEGRISAIGKLTGEKGERIIQANGKYLLPGFIDIHNHGALGFDFSLGLYEKSNNAFTKEKALVKEAIERTLKYYLSKGITRFYPTSLAAPLEDLKTSFQMIDQYIKAQLPLHHLIGGINLEGSFLKLPEYAGAQNPAYFFDADIDTFSELNKASGNRIRIVNIPPEHGSKGMELIRFASKEGIIVAGGHTGAEAEQFFEAIAEGLSLAVHFFNGPSRSSSKSFYDGGAEEAMLRSDKVSLELIVDGYHVHPAYVRDAIARKEMNRIILITDSVFVNGCEDIDTFNLGGIPGQISKNREYLQVIGKDDTLFGSVLTTDKGFSNVVNWLQEEMTGIWTRKHKKYSLEEAMLTASKMISSNPAKLLGIEQEFGSIEIGKSADLILGDWEEGLKIEMVISQGTIHSDFQ